MIKKRNMKTMTPEESRKVLGRNLPFGAAEAYKLLRTNLSFSMADAKKCRVIGVTSSIRGEGKSTTAMNLAYTMAQTGGKVLLLEADLRLSTVAKRLRIAPRPGLTNLLAGLCSGNDVLQASGLIDNLWVITAGSTPPNPAELLASRQMEKVMSTLADEFDVIIVDLPPVTAVTDALLMSKMVDGMIVVVRQNYCDKRALDETVRQLQFADARILGFVMSGAETSENGYHHYGQYYRQ